MSRLGQNIECVRLPRCGELRLRCSKYSIINAGGGKRFPIKTLSCFRAVACALRCLGFAEPGSKGRAGGALRRGL